MSQPIQPGKSKLHDEMQQQRAVKGMSSAMLVLVESTNSVAGGVDMLTTRWIERFDTIEDFRSLTELNRALGRGGFYGIKNIQN